MIETKNFKEFRADVLGKLRSLYDSNRDKISDSFFNFRWNIGGGSWFRFYTNYVDCINFVNNNQNRFFKHSDKFADDLCVPTGRFEMKTILDEKNNIDVYFEVEFIFARSGQETWERWYSNQLTNISRYSFDRD